MSTKPKVVVYLNDDGSVCVSSDVELDVVFLDYTVDRCDYSDPDDAENAHVYNTDERDRCCAVERTNTLSFGTPDGLWQAIKEEHSEDDPAMLVRIREILNFEGES